MAVTGLLTLSASDADANISLFTTTSDFTGWSGGNASTVAASTAWDSDGGTINGVGNASNAGGASTAGSLQVTQTTQIGYNAIAYAPSEDYNPAFMSTFDPGSTPAYTAATNYGPGTETAYSGTIQYTYTIPTISSGGYFQPGLLLNDNGGYRTSFASSTVNDGTVDGLSTYTATIPYNVFAGSFGYLSFGIFFNSNYVPTSPIYIDNIQEVTANSPVNANWITPVSGAWESDSNWNPSEPAIAGSTATFDSDGGTISGLTTVTLSSPVTINSITFNTSAASYTIANGGAGNIITNNINVLAGSHTINAQLSTGNGAVFNISSGASLTATDVVDTVGYYHGVTLNGGGSLTVNALNNAALNDYGVTLTTTAANTGQYVYLASGSVWNIEATSTIEQYYDDGSTTLNLGAGVTLYTQDHTVQIGGTLAGSGNLSLGGGPNGFDSGYYASLSGSNSGYSGAITITGGGTLTIATDVNLGNGSATNTLNISNGTLDITGSVVGTHGLIIGAGNGTINTAGNSMQVSSLSGAGTLTLAGGNTLTVSPQTSSGVGVRSLSVGGINLQSSNLALGSATVQASRTLLTVGSGGLSLSGSTGAWTSTVDIGNNDLIVQNGSLATITNQVTQGYANGTWQGSGGILSSAAAADSTHLTAVGVATGLTSFDGATIPSTDLIIKYTYYGDANLDGAVDGSDYTLIDNGFNNHLSGWQNGDFNYDGKVDGSDYTLIDNAFNTQGATLGTNPLAVIASSTSQIAGGTAVPEPATLGLVGFAAIGLLGRRKIGRRKIIRESR